MLNRTLLSIDFCYWSRLRMRVIGRRVDNRWANSDQTHTITLLGLAFGGFGPICKVTETEEGARNRCTSLPICSLLLRFLPLPLFSPLSPAPCTPVIRMNDQRHKGYVENKLFMKRTSPVPDLPRHKAIYFSWFGPELFCLLLGPLGFNCWFSSAPVFLWCCSTPQGSPCVGRNTLLSSPHLCFIIVFICDLFVSRDDPLMS